MYDIHKEINLDLLANKHLINVKQRLRYSMDTSAHLGSRILMDANTLLKLIWTYT